MVIQTTAAQQRKVAGVIIGFYGFINGFYSPSLFIYLFVYFHADCERAVLEENSTLNTNCDVLGDPGADAIVGAAFPLFRWEVSGRVPCRRHGVIASARVVVFNRRRKLQPSQIRPLGVPFRFPSSLFPSA